MKSEKGQVVVLIAFIIIGLMGAMALAIDGSMILFDRRNAQSAADAAALAGSYELAKNFTDSQSVVTAKVKNAAIARAADNGFTITTSDVEYPPASGTFQFVSGDTNPLNYVAVTIHSDVETSFVHLIGFTEVITNVVRAVTHVTPGAGGPLLGGFGLVAMAPGHDCTEGYGGIGVLGSGTITLTNGGIFVNSLADNVVDSNCDAFEIENPVTTASLVVAGDVYVKKPGDLKVNPGPSVINDPSVQVPFPPINKPPIPTCSIAATQYSKTQTIAGITYTSEMTPGYWTNGAPTINTWLKPGIYCISGNFSISSAKIGGNEVLIFLTGPEPCNFIWNGQGSLNLTAYRTDPYNGLVLFVDPGDYSTISTKYMTLNGTLDAHLTGTFYAPTCIIHMQGTLDSFATGQVIGYKLNITGNTKASITYSLGNSWQGVPQPGTIDISQ